MIIQGRLRAAAARGGGSTNSRSNHTTLRGAREEFVREAAGDEWTRCPGSRRGGIEEHARRTGSGCWPVNVHVTIAKRPDRG